MASNTFGWTSEVFGNVPEPTTQTAPFSAETFQICILVIGAIGLLGNAGALFILASSQQARKKPTNLLIMNQLTLDMCSCGFLMTSHSIQLASGYLSGQWGLISCYLFYSDMVPFITLVGSIASLVVITFERYVKIVHSIAHRKYFRTWMVHVGVAVTWINGVLLNIAVFWTSQVVDGVCESFSFWPNNVIQVAYSAFVLVWEYFLPLALFAYFYGHIFVVIRKSNRVFAGANRQSNNTHSKHVNDSQRSIIKTLVMVTALFAVCWGPNQIYYLLTLLYPGTNNTFYWWSVVFAFLNVCLNPFIYAYNLKAIRNQVKKWLRMGSNEDRTGPELMPSASAITGSHQL